eukprot:6627711-Lingulodinium_polyedra.AAC.1
MGVRFEDEGICVESAGEDLPDAYRLVPVRPEDYDVSIVAFRHAKRAEVVFQEMYGLAFGLSEAVPAFNRKPFLYSAL